MQKHFLRDLELIHQQLYTLFGNVEQMIDKAVRALCEQQVGLVDEVIANDEIVDDAEVHIEEECLKILALHQPVAGDLRRISVVLKINTDLERIADLACNIAERAQFLHQHPFFPIPDHLQEMVSIAKSMVQSALDAFVRSDAELAKSVITMDDQVDNLNRQVIQELTQLMKEDSSLIVPALYCFSASRHVERIGDHAENIAEDIIYLVDGEMVRHRHGQFTSQSKSHRSLTSEEKEVP